MGTNASEVLLIKQTMDTEIAQYCRMALPVALRDELVKRTVSFRMEQATRVLECFIKRYDIAEKGRSVPPFKK